LVARIDTGVVVVGAGGAGLAAAAAAAEEGARVVVVEKRRIVGGNAAWAEGIFAVESPAQRRNGIDIRKDEMFRLAMDYAHWGLNGKVVRAFIDKSGDTVRWLEEKGVRFNSIPPFSCRQRHRVFHNPDGGGPEILQALLEECRVRGVRILCDAAVEQILLDESGRARGVALSMHGTRFEIGAASVIVATGGFAGNRELLRKYCDFYTDDFSLPGLPHMGDGLAMTTDVGAATEGLGRVQGSGPNFPGNISSLGVLAREPGPIWISQKGERFIDEATCFEDFECINAILRLPGKQCYVLLDQEMVSSIVEHGFVRVYQGSLRPSGASPVPSLPGDLELAAKGLMPVAQVKQDLCNGCGVCADSCPDTAIQLETSYAAGQGISPCSAACPAGVNVRAYVHLLRNGLLEEASALLRESLPLPAVTGRVCPHFCEAQCARKEVDQPVNINALERFVADSGRGWTATPAARKCETKIAVIGSGPAGLSCSYFLARLGYPVTVFEAEALPGGMLRMGIPEHRLPRDILDEQISYIRNMGVEFRLGKAVGRDVALDALEQEFGAIFFAGGAQSSKRIDIDGIELAGVHWGLDLLRSLNLGQRVEIGSKVVVIGGGNVAADVALVALRLGVEEVSMVCLESGPEVPALEEEIAQAVAEGVAIHEGWGPKRVLGDAGRVVGVELIRCASATDPEGCFNPSYDEASTMRLEADTVVFAIGQAVTPSLVPDPMMIGTDGTVTIDSGTLETRRKAVFAGGDATGGTASVVKAIADGRRAAQSIDRYLRGEDREHRASAPPEKMKNPPRERMTPMARIETPARPVTETIADFGEVKLGFDDVMAKMESERCMTCGSRPVVTMADCKYCRACEVNCPTQAVYGAPVRQGTPLVRVSESLEDIARWMGTDPQVLRATVQEYNAFCDDGHDPVFAKERIYLQALRTPPYYALRCNIVLLTTMGGVRINERMEVLGAQEIPIPGLYAAGNDTGGWECETYNVLLPGSTFGFAINSGRTAGESAARYAMEESGTPSERGSAPWT